MMTWWTALDNASKAHGRPLAVNITSMVQLLTTVGFTNVEVNCVPLPINNTESQCEQCRLAKEPPNSYLSCKRCEIQFRLNRHYGAVVADMDNINGISNGLFAKYGAKLPKGWSKEKLKYDMENHAERVYNKL